MPRIEDEEYIQAPPFAMQVELTEGCNLRCSFCGLNGIRSKENNFKFMTSELAHTLIKRLNETADWTPRIEFAMHGEPSVNPEMIDILRLFRSELPTNTHLMMTSNGAGFMKDPSLIDKALAHLNVLALDWYQNVSIVPKILDRYKGAHTPLRYPENDAANPHRRRKPNQHEFVIVQDIAEATKGTHASLNNHAGSGAPKNRNSDGKRCAKPFREISIRWDGSVAICCNDWIGQFKAGNVVANTLEEIWNGPAMQAARKKLYYGERDFGPCDGCDAVSYRPGLLPDQKGKQELPRAGKADLQAIASALRGKPYTLPVLREWETTADDRLGATPQTKKP